MAGKANPFSLITERIVFSWTCPRCDHRQREYIESGSPCAEVLCDSCNAGIGYHELSPVARNDWDTALRHEKIPE